MSCQRGGASHVLVLAAAVGLGTVACRSANRHASPPADNMTSGGVASFGPQRHGAPATILKTSDPRCLAGAGHPLAVGALSLEWQREDVVLGLTLADDGRLLRQGTVVGRFFGACALDSRAQVILFVDANDVVLDRHNQRIGAFQRRESLVVDGNELTVGEVFTTFDGSGTAVTNGGAVYLVPADRPPFELPAHVTGDIAKGRRAALLALDIGHRLTSVPKN